MVATMGALTGYRLDESLTSGLGTTVDATYAFAAPNSFESHVVENGSTFSTAWIGYTRYTRQGNGTWKVERGAPAVPVPTYIWDSFRPYRDVRILGSARVDGVRTTELAFAGGDQELPVWFRLWSTPTGTSTERRCEPRGTSWTIGTTTTTHRSRSTPERSERMRHRMLVAAAMVLAVVAAACSRQETPPSPGQGPIAVEHTAPTFSLKSSSGATVALSDYAGKPVLVYFSMGPG